ncbi:MATE family efflux transporter [Helcobacillus massiliensis]|uniref:MATE family efflux transporter n=1 Tax=Helcobacillus massiliensis TaxID=521392 RepID=UPI0021A6FBBA|nr:MATE family efflux transporter [Helcobacillus massiliensis]MCT1556766.1 MATE family efflux transporter [Helcobacillus massiliensis]MCT2035590.1 MATE family efflux transporter [Helcobacillus massiliensis]MCT2330958.1 MATE family efflux transporter [Helcobacillus massiliensis]
MPASPASPAPVAAPPSSRMILGLAVPALGALVAEPLFVLVDSAFVAYVSTPSLAGLGLASTVLTTIVGLAIFLAYATTADVARAVGAGDMRRAIAKGVDASWLALLIGAVCLIGLVVGGPALLGLFGPSDAVMREATTYLRISAFGLPAMLMIQAASGLVRGLQNTTITLIIAVAGAVANIPLNWVLIFALDLGIAGSAVGTVVCQWLMAAAYIVIVVRGARRHAAPLRPHLGGVRSVWSSARWLFIRTLTLRIVVLATTAAALKLGDVQLAAHQLMNTVFMLTSLALDSLAIAAQALTGKYLGARDRASVTTVMRTLIRWSVLGGAVVSLLLAAAVFVVPGVFTPDPEVQVVLFWTMVVLLLAQPLAGYVFVLDGVFMGAGDAKYLAKAGVITMCAYLPFAAAIWWAASVAGGAGGTDGVAGSWVFAEVSGAPVGLPLLWAAFTVVFLGARAVTLWWRTRTDDWMHLDDAPEGAGAQG